MITKKKFNELPIGTIFTTDFEGYISFEIKCSKNCIFVIEDYSFLEWIGKKLNVNEKSNDLEYMSIADESISKLFHIPKDVIIK